MPRDFLQLRSFDNYIQANIVMNMLLHHHVNCHLKDENTVTIDPLLSPALGGIKLMVHHAHVERARDLLDAAERDYLQDIPCPDCQAHALSPVWQYREYRNKFSAMLAKLANGGEVETRKVYRCGQCGREFKDLPS